MSVRDAFRGQAANCAALGSAFMARLLGLIADRLAPGIPVADRVLDWPGDASANADNVPIRLAGALHALRLEGTALVDVYPPCEVDDESLWSAVEDAMARHSDRDQLRLLAYLWADQPERLARTRAAIDIARTVPAEISTGDAGEWLACELARPSNGRLRVVVHTVAWQYFPPETRAAAEAAMNAAAGPLARLAMEYDGGKGAGVTLTIWPGGQPRIVARADFHGRWVAWTDDVLIRDSGPERCPT